MLGEGDTPGVINETPNVPVSLGSHGEERQETGDIYLGIHLDFQMGLGFCKIVNSHGTVH